MSKRVIMVFLDGVGIGERDAGKNPFFRYPMKTFEGIFGRTPSIEEPEDRKSVV